MDSYRHRDCYPLQLTWPRDSAVALAVDYWLTTNMQFAHPSSYLLMGDGPANEVICAVQRFRIQGPHTGTLIRNPDIFILYITATASPELGVPILSCSSPRAILGRYIGFEHDPGAPAWTRWDNSIMSFHQPRCSFADMFARMASWEENRTVKGLSYRMIQWAKMITVGTWLNSDLLAETPQKLPKNDDVMIETQPRPFNKSSFDVLESPCQRGKSDGVGAELGLDANWDSEDETETEFIPRTLLFTEL